MNDTLYFPMFVDLSEKHIVIVGAGRIASRRIMTLLDFAGRITVIAPEMADDVKKMINSKKLELRQRDFLPEDLIDADIVFAATNDKEVNMAVYDEAKARGIPVNVSHDQRLCDFFFPAVIVDEPMVVGLTASGKDHAGVKALKKKIAELLDKRQK